MMQLVCGQVRVSRGLMARFRGCVGPVPATVMVAMMRLTIVANARPVLSIALQSDTIQVHTH
eukprot:CAMPEP_0185196132 /NCGR_PEP_ID=MMETSP1140-20130426/36696_1 /TAXON_ID=298111 /ORGANISM="Pavlova sp., Strain CCMP459" /LENGTH=61 /DNA_ID=CAMNT_0027763147 /DNA_START=22 /DNA_END=204 /DNA_ORIENTATION=-